MTTAPMFPGPHLLQITPYLIPGQLVEGYDYESRAYAAEGAVQNGLLLVRGTSEDQAQLPPALPSADPDAIKTSFASSTSAQTLVASDFNGTIGAGQISPPRSMTFTFGGTVADFGAIDIVVTYTDPNGDQKATVLHFDGATPGTYALSVASSRAVSIFIPAGTNTGGTLEIGLSNAVVEYGSLDIRGICRQIPQATQNREGVPAGYDHGDTETVAAIYDGWVCCPVEATAAVNVTDGDSVFVRVVESGSDIRGQLTGPQEAGGSFARVLGSTWKVAKSAGENSVVRIKV